MTRSKGHVSSRPVRGPGVGMVPSILRRPIAHQLGQDEARFSLQVQLQFNGAINLFGEDFNTHMRLIWAINQCYIFIRVNCFQFSLVSKSTSALPIWRLTDNMSRIIDTFPVEGKLRVSRAEHTLNTNRAQKRWSLSPLLGHKPVFYLKAFSTDEYEWKGKGKTNRFFLLADLVLIMLQNNTPRLSIWQTLKMSYLAWVNARGNKNFNLFVIRKNEANPQRGGNEKQNLNHVIVICAQVRWKKNIFKSEIVLWKTKLEIEF